MGSKIRVVEFKLNKLESHPFDKSFVPDGATHLVIGTFPTTKSKWSYSFFYPNTTNKFWDTMAEIYWGANWQRQLLKPKRQDEQEIKDDALEQRKLIAQNLKFGITDIIDTCFRENNTSKDEELFVSKYIPILDILKSNPSIKILLLTGKSKGTSVHHHFYQYLVQQGIEFVYKEQDNILLGSFSFNGTTYQVITLPSTSSRNTVKFNLVALYKAALNLV